MMPAVRERIGAVLTTLKSGDLETGATFQKPLLLTRGDQSPPFFCAILEQIAAAVPQAQQYTFRGAGHVPQMTNADEYVRVVTDFVQRRHAGGPASAPT
ncbi:MAG TPA: alpha/beta hydrolase [Vicinamibacterales bacterium]